MIWHFCGKASTKNIELIQERPLRFLLNEQKSTYHELLEKCNYTTMLIRRIKTIAMEVKYYGAHIWNLLPNEMGTADILSFKV